jgi:hypothetical protein
MKIVINPCFVTLLSLVTDTQKMFYFYLSGFDAGTDFIWENHNQGKLWKDIKHKYEEKEN